MLGEEPETWRAAEAAAAFAGSLGVADEAAATSEAEG